MHQAWTLHAECCLADVSRRLVQTCMPSLLIYLPADQQLRQRPDAALSAALGSLCMQQHIWLPAEPQCRCTLSTLTSVCM